MFNNISVIRDKFGYVSVWDKKSTDSPVYCVNFGKRDVNHAFANNVQNKMLSMGYAATEYKGETKFFKI